MNIAVFVKNLTSGGAEKQSVILAKALSHTYHVHYIVFNKKKVHKKYLDALMADGSITVEAFSGNVLSRYMAFVDYLRNNRISAVFSYLTAANVLACLAGRRLGIDIFTGLRNSQLPFTKRIVERILTNRLATLTVANCYSGKNNFVKQGFDPDKIVVIPNCFENIAPHSDKQENNRIQIITVGRFVEQKDYETAIRAIAALHSRNENIAYHIVGYGKQEGMIRKWIRKYGIGDITQVHINPDNISQLLEKSDIYLSTSLFEGTSNSILEAMNADLPIVATHVGDNTLIVENRTNGFICKIKEVENISACMELLVRSYPLRVKMGKLGKRKLEHDYSVRMLHDNYVKILSKTCPSSQYGS